MLRLIGVSAPSLHRESTETLTKLSSPVIVSHHMLSTTGGVRSCLSESAEHSTS